MKDAKGQYEDTFRDPGTQGQILLKLPLEERALSMREPAELIDKDVSVVTGNLGEL